MNIFEKGIERFSNYVAGRIMTDMEKRNVSLRDYYEGDHPDQIKVKPGSYDDNFATNFIGLAISRGVSRLFNGGIEFKLPEGTEAQQKLLKTVWDTNKQEQLLYQLGLNGGVYGTPFLKIAPGGTYDRITGLPCDRLIALDPEITTVKVNRFDVDYAEEYKIEFSIKEEKDTKSYREITRQSREDDYEVENAETFEKPDTWMVEHWIMNKTTGGKWVLDPNNPPYEWPYNFPPIIHWKNLPSLKSSHGWRGSTDAEWAIGSQDKLNFADSNIGKTIRLNAAPPIIVTGVTEEQVRGMTTGAGSFHWFGNPEAKAYAIEANADITGSMSFSERLESKIFELMREVPPAVIKTMGSGLTNFVMRVIFSDALDKTDTKRELYGDAILEINRRLLVLNGFEGEQANPGMIEWGDPLPTNPVEQIAEDTFLLANGLASKKTIAAHYDIDFEAEQESLNEEAANKNAVGGDLLRQFVAGRGQQNQETTNVNQGV